jgi:hypothetical protein
MMTLGQQVGKLEAEIEQLRMANDGIQRIAVRFEADTERLRTEIERLQALVDVGIRDRAILKASLQDERDRNVSGLIEYEKKCDEIGRLQAELVRVAALGVPGF